MFSIEKIKELSESLEVRKQAQLLGDKIVADETDAVSKMYPNYDALQFSMALCSHAVYRLALMTTIASRDIESLDLTIKKLENELNA